MDHRLSAFFRAFFPCCVNWYNLKLFDDSSRQNINPRFFRAANPLLVEDKWEPNSFATVEGPIALDFIKAMIVILSLVLLIKRASFKSIKYIFSAVVLMVNSLTIALY